MKTNNMQPKHTPDQWHATNPDAGGSVLILRENRTPLYGGSLEVLARCHKDNAAFIVRACNSHEILVRALRDICRHRLKTIKKQELGSSLIKPCLK